jgi:hypothetical protein
LKEEANRGSGVFELKRTVKRHPQRPLPANTQENAKSDTPITPFFFRR